MATAIVSAAYAPNYIPDMIVDAQTHNAAHSVVIDLVTEGFRLAEWDVFRPVAECSEDTVHRLGQ